MDLSEARAECERWLGYLERQRMRSIEIQRLASERRRGTVDEAETRRRLKAIDMDVRVYDGAKLAEAVRVLLQHIEAANEITALRARVLHLEDLLQAQELRKMIRGEDGKRS